MIGSSGDSSGQVVENGTTSETEMVEITINEGGENGVESTRNDGDGDPKPENAENVDMCVICLTNPATNQLEKCKHKVVCNDQECVDMVIKHNKCPICRRTSNRNIVNMINGKQVGRFVSRSNLFGDGSGNEDDSPGMLLCGLLLLVVVVTLITSIVASISAACVGALLENEATKNFVKDDQYIGRFVSTMLVYVLVAGAGAVLGHIGQLGFAKCFEKVGWAERATWMRRNSVKVVTVLTYLLSCFLPPLALFDMAKVNLAGAIAGNVIGILLTGFLKFIFRGGKCDNNENDDDEEGCTQFILDRGRGIIVAVVVYVFMTSDDGYFQINDGILEQSTALGAACIAGLFDTAQMVVYFPYIFPQFFLQTR